MNENINLVEILKNCPKGTKLYSTIYGNVEFNCIEPDCEYSIIINIPNYDGCETLTSDGRMQKDYDGECTLFPSKEQRDWSKFKMNKPKFDPKTFKPFDKVLARMISSDIWVCDFFSHIHPDEEHCVSVGSWSYNEMIPYNKETKHLVGTTKKAPEFYRYWED